MDQVVPWQPLLDFINPVYPKDSSNSGRPPYPRQPTYRISVQDSNGVIYKTASPDGAQCRVRSITEGV